jgi:hypothetical protein
MPLKDRDAILAKLQEIEAVLRSDVRRHRILVPPPQAAEIPLNQPANASSSRRYILPSPRSRLQPTAPRLCHTPLARGGPPPVVLDMLTRNTWPRTSIASERGGRCAPGSCGGDQTLWARAGTDDREREDDTGIGDRDGLIEQEARCCV